jgi:hypothetical protein
VTEAALALSAVGIFVAVIAGYFTWKTIPPKRQLSLSLTTARLLTNAAGSVGSDIRIVHSKLGNLRSPSVAWISLVNSGRADVASSHFDGDQPLRLDLGTPILQQLEPVSEGGGPGSQPPSIAFENSTVLVGPGRIAHKQRIIYPVLVDGEARLQIQRNPLIDVAVATLAARVRWYTRIPTLITGMLIFAIIQAVSAQYGNADSGMWVLAAVLAGVIGGAIAGVMADALVDRVSPPYRR